MAITRQKLPPFGGAGRSKSVNKEFMQDWCRMAWAFGGHCLPPGQTFHAGMKKGEALLAASPF